MTAIRETSFVSDTYSVFATWLASYFDGASHAVGAGAPVPFPAAALVFGQAALPQPLNPAGTAVPRSSIATLWAGTARTRLAWETVDGRTQQMCYQHVRLNFWIRAEQAAGDGTNARLLARQTAERLTAILGNAAATRVLGQVGLHHVRPSAPEPVAEASFILLLVPCNVTLRYPVLSQPTA